MSNGESASTRQAAQEKDAGANEEPRPARASSESENASSQAQPEAREALGESRPTPPPPPPEALSESARPRRDDFDTVEHPALSESENFQRYQQEVQQWRDSGSYLESRGYRTQRALAEEGDCRSRRDKSRESEATDFRAMSRTELGTVEEGANATAGDDHLADRLKEPTRPNPAVDSREPTTQVAAVGLRVETVNRVREALDGLEVDIIEYFPRGRLQPVDGALDAIAACLDATTAGFVRGGGPVYGSLRLSSRHLFGWFRDGDHALLMAFPISTERDVLAAVESALVARADQ